MLELDTAFAFDKRDLDEDAAGRRAPGILGIPARDQSAGGHKPDAPLLAKCGKAEFRVAHYPSEASAELQSLREPPHPPE